LDYASWILFEGESSIQTSPKLFEQANKATNEQIKREAHILANGLIASIDGPAEVKALCKQVVSYFEHIFGSP
jgi:hypothetical protein